MGKSSYREKRLAGQVSLALAAGMFSALPVAHGMPTLDPAAPHTGGTPDATAVIDANDPNKMNVTGSRTNNVVDWKDFSIAKGETVAFQNVGEQAANYMNIVTGHATSNIEGTMTNNGDIYLINPNGVIFGKTAQVNVGNLYVSTREASQNMADTFRGTNADPVNDVGTILSAVTMDNALKSDVVNLIDQSGYVKADTVVMEGNNIRFLNTSSVGTKESTVTENAGKYTVSAHPEATNIILRSDTDGYIHVGDTNNAAGKYTAQTIKKDDQTETYKAATGVNYKVVRDVEGLNAINTDATTLSGNYMLANDIDASTMTAPIGKASSSSTTVTESASNLPFKGKFDGMFFTVRNLNNTNEFSGLDAKSFVGLFAYAKNATIENIGVENTNLPYQKAGGLVGYADNTTIRNVWNIGRTSLTDTAKAVGKDTFNKSVGGLVGVLNNSSLTNAYNQGYISGGGLVGVIQGVTDSNKVVISNAYNIGKLVADTNNKLCGIAAQYVSGSSGVIKDVYTASLYRNDDYRNYIGDKTYQIETIVGTLNQGKLTDVYIVNKENTSIWEPILGSYTQTKLTALTKGIGTSITAEQQITQDATSREAYTIKSNTWNISSEGGSNSAWRIYEGYSLPLLTSFMKAKGTVAVEYDYYKEQKEYITPQTQTFSSLAGGTPNKVYNADQILGTGDNYALNVTYLGMNANTNSTESVLDVDNAEKDVHVTQNNRKNVYAPTTDAQGNPVVSSFALFSGGQQGYDLYGNNFQINPRTITYNSTSSTFTKEYDGSSSGIEALKAALSSSGSGSTTGFLNKDADSVKFQLGNGVTATYDSVDVNATKVTIANAETPGAIKVVAADNPTDAEAYKNYIVGTVTGLNGEHAASITPRAIKVSLKKASGITKTYDGTAAVTDQNKGTTAGYLPSENLVIATDCILAADADSGITVTKNDTARYVDVNGETGDLDDAVNAGAHKVAYDGIALSDGNNGTPETNIKLQDYKLVDVNGNELTAGYILADGSIAKRSITETNLATFATGGIEKDYDGSDTLADVHASISVNTTNLVDNPNGTNNHSETNITGLLYNDRDQVKFITTGDAVFYAENGTTRTADASTATGDGIVQAKKAKYTVALDPTSNPTALGNYEIASNVKVTGTGTINKRNISATLVVPTEGINKDYDGTAAVSSPQWKYVYSAGATTDEKKALEEIVASDASGDAPKAKITVTANYMENGVADKNVAYTAADSDTVTTKDIQYTLALSGSKAANYVLTAADEDNDNNTLTGTIANAGKINPVDLGLTIANVTKRYDGQSYVNGTTPTPATVAAAISITGAPAGKTKQGDNFDVSQISGLYGNGTTDAAFTANPDVYYVNGEVENKDVKYTGFHAALGDENYKNYTIQGKTWKTSNTAYGKGMITKATIGAAELAQKTNIVNPQPTLTKTYDGSTGYDVSDLTASDFLTVNYAGLAIPDNSLSYTIAEAVYTGTGAKNVGTNKDMTMTFTFTTNGLGNFDLVEIDDTDPNNVIETPVSSLDVKKTGFKGNITAKDLTLTLNQDTVTKVYDGTDTLKASGTTIGDATIKGWFGNLATNTQIVSGDTVEIELYENDAHKKAYYDNENASTSNKNIYISQVGLTGADAGNYNLKVVDAVGTKTAGNDGKINNIQGFGTINKRTITVESVGDVDRDYSATAGATVTKVAGTNSAGVAYDDRIRIKVNNTYQPDTNGNDTTDVSDWEILQAKGLVDATGLITGVASITGTYQNSADNEGAANVRRGENRSVQSKTVTYTGLLNALGGENGNYSIVDTVTGQGTITPVKLNMNGTTVSLNTSTADSITRTYNGTAAVDNADSKLTFNDSTLTTAFTNNVLLLDEAVYTVCDTETGNYVNDKNVGNNKTVTYKFKLNDNENVDNYDLYGTYATSDTTAQFNTLNVGQITPATIYAIGYKESDLTNDQKAQVTKVYDRTDSAPVITGTDGRLLWVKTNLDSEGEGLAKYGTDDVSVVAASMAYDNKNAATSDTKMVYSGITLSGTDAGNYTLSNDTATGYGSITRKELEFTTANDKYYDGSAAATQNGVNPSDVNIVTAAVDAWKTAGDILYSEDGEGNKTYDEVTIAQLVGEYGTWNPSADGQSGTWTPSADVKRASATDRTVQQRDVLYTGITLGGTDGGNYVVKSSTKNITRGNTTLQETVYFDDFIHKGTIKPIALTYSANQNSDVTETWTAANKVYDGTASVVGFDTNGNPITANNLTINYSKDGMTGTLDYKVVSAVYKSTTEGEADADAGTGKTVAYKVELAPLTLNNYDLAPSVTNRYASTNEITSTAGGNIARRLLNVTPGTNNVKIYDGSEVLVAAGTAYTASMTDATNPNATGLVVGHDNVSVTYAANFDDKNASVDPDAAATDQGWTAKNVTYTYTLADGGDSANYTLVSNPANDAAARTTTKDTTGGIKRREVYVDFVQGKGTGLDKVYDNTSLIGEDIASLITLKPVDINAKTGVVDNTVTLDTDNVTAHYVDKNGAASVDSDAKLGITTREVYFQNLNLTGTGKENYVVKAKNHDGQVKKTATDPTKTEQTLIGTGSIARRKIEVAVTGTLPTKEYDRTTNVLSTDGTAYVNNGGRTLTKDDPYLKIADGVVDVSDGKLLGDEAAAYADADVTIESALYHDRNAQDGLGVTYKLKVNNQNYELVRYSIDTQGNKYIEGTGNITPKTISAKAAPLVTKTYDGNSMITDTSGLASGLFGAVEDGFANGVFKDDIPSLLKNISGTYISTTSGAASADTEADADSILGKTKNIKVSYTLNDDTNGTGKNYQFAGGTTRSVTDEVHANAGRIDRAQLTLTPNNVTYSAGDNIPADGYAGTLSGFQHNEQLDNDYSYAFRRDGNTSTSPGNYSLVGYVNRPGEVMNANEDGLIYYNNLGNSGNYYFVTAPNQALHVEAKADVADAVHRDTIADKKFIPDDYSYNRMSQDEDLTRLKRESQATVQYTEKGVNTDESSQGGLLASMDIQGAGSVVNLNGAVIRTSAVPEKPEEIAAEAALPVSEASEADFSSIDVENTDEADGSQSMLEVLTNASNKAENRGTSIVINTMDEDEEDAEEEKSRRALIVDRSNIGIETLGDAVNLDQMIG